MKTTGVVRRMDDLGRLIVPKSVRERMAIKPNDPFEIFTDIYKDGSIMIIFKSYIPNYDREE